MKQFDEILNGRENQFIKSDSSMLSNLFGKDDIESFWVADMDFKVASSITEEINRLADRGVYAYEFAQKSIYREISKWNKNRHALNLSEDSFIQVPGVLTAISILIRKLTAVGEGVLIQTPVFHQFTKVIKSANRKIVKNPLKIVNGKYEIDFKDFEEKLKTGKVRMVLLCNPHNPVGRVWTSEEMVKLVDISNRYKVTIVSDEIHSDIVYSGHKFNSIASVSKSGHVALIGSPAKTFGMQSISNGYMYIPDEAMFQMIYNTVDSMYLSHGNAFTTFATIAAYSNGGHWVNDLLKYLELNIAWIKEYLETEASIVKMFEVEGTYQVWLDFSGINLSAEELKTRLVNDAKIALTPGSWFGEENAYYFRMNIASPLSKIQDAFRNIKRILNE